MKRYFISLFIVIALLRAVPVYSVALPGRLDKAGHWAEVYFEEAIDKGWMEAKMASEADKYITRAQFIRMLELAVKITPFNDKLKDLFKTPSVLNYDFSDTNGHWISTEGWLKTAMDFGLVAASDYTDNKLNPDGYITRRECMLMLSRALGQVYPATYFFGGPLTFKDWPAVPAWLKGYAYRLAAYFVLKGYPDRTMRQNQNATIAEATAFIVRLEDEMTRGIDENLKVYVSDLSGNGIVAADLVKTAPAQKLDSIIYIPVRALYNAGSRVYAINKDLNYSWDKSKQILSFEYGTRIEYQPGNIYYGFNKAALPHWYADMALDYEARLLYGEVMIPVYSPNKAKAAYMLSSAFSLSENCLIIKLNYPDKTIG